MNAALKGLRTCDPHRPAQLPSFCGRRQVVAALGRWCKAKIPSIVSVRLGNNSVVLEHQLQVEIRKALTGGILRVSADGSSLNRILWLEARATPGACSGKNH